MNKTKFHKTVMKNIAAGLQKTLNENEYWDEPINATPHVAEVATVDYAHDDFDHHMMMVDQNSGSATVYGFDSVDDIIDMYYSVDDHDYNDINWIGKNTGNMGAVFFDPMTDSYYFMID